MILFLFRVKLIDKSHVQSRVSIGVAVINASIPEFWILPALIHRAATPLSVGMLNASIWFLVFVL